jgi:hypothetical protein
VPRAWPRPGPSAENRNGLDAEWHPAHPDQRRGEPEDLPSILAINPNGKPILVAAVGYQAKAGEQLYSSSRRDL